MRIKDFDLRDLHDAVLKEISVKWEETASVRLDFRPNEAYIKPSRPVIMTCEGLKRLVCPQQNPWGPSDFVNRVTVEGAESDTRVSVEMQSGDVIVIEGGSFEITIRASDHMGEPG